jgi:hypothetical protein
VLWRIGVKQTAARSAEASFDAETAAASRRTPHGPAAKDERGRWAASRQGFAPGSVFAAYLLLTGAARFLVEFIRINPRSFFGLTNAQAASVASMIAGAALWWYVARKKPGT